MQSIVRLRYRLADFSEVVALISFVLVFLIFAFQADNFLTPLSLTNILTFASIKGIFVIGVAMLMISGEFDLSVGSILAVGAYVFGILMEFGIIWVNHPFGDAPLMLIPAGIPLVALAVALLVSAFLGYINGWIVVNTGIPSFIATLGTMLAFRGIARALGQLELTKIVTDENGQRSLQSFESEADVIRYTGETPALFNVLNGDIEFINRLSEPAAGARLVIFWFLLFLIIAVIFMRYTRYGSWVYATGGNRQAAKAQGVRINQVLMSNFVITGLLAGFAGVAAFAARPAIDPARGEGWELIAVAACVIGGIWLEGGYGTIIGAAVGMLLLQMVEQGLILAGVDIQLFQATIGFILILAVISNTYLSKQ